VPEAGHRPVGNVAGEEDATTTPTADESPHQASRRPRRCFGWTPLAIAAGYRFGNFKPSPETEAAVREVMIAGGVTPPKTVVAKTQQIY
jgi:hypothetical protein